MENGTIGMKGAEQNLDIMYLASHGFAVRMLLQTDLLKLLTAKGLKVGIVTPDAADDSLADYCKENNIVNIEYVEKPVKWLHNIELFRRYLLENVKNNPALYEKHLRMVEQAKSSSSMRSRVRLSNFADGLAKFAPFTKKLYKKFENRFSKSADAEAIIKKYAPRLLVSTIPVSVREAQLLYAASRQKVKTVTQILSWDNITCKGHFRMLSDEYIVWGPIMRDELKRFYKVKDQHIHECGVPHFDLHFKNRESLKWKAGDEKYLVFAMSAPYFAPREIDIVEKIASWIEEGRWPGLKFIVRPHPQNVIGNMADLTWLKRLDALSSENTSIDYPEINEGSNIRWSMKQSDMEKMSKLIAGSTAILNSGSTMTIDGLCYHNPVIVTAFDNEEELPWHISVKRVMEYEHFRNIVQSGAVAVAWNYRDLEDVITEAIENPTARLEEMKSILFAEVGVDDGKATERVVEVLHRMSLN